MENTLNIIQVSPAQRRLMTLDGAGQKGMAHICTVQITGKPDLNRLTNTLNNVVAKYDIFRTAFVSNPYVDFACQQVEEEREVTIATDRLEQLSDSGKANLIQARMNEMAIALSGSGKTVQAALLQADDHALLILGISAMVGDVVTLKQVLNECLETTGTGTSADTEQAIPFIQFSEWHNELLAEGDEEAQAFWKDNSPTGSTTKQYVFQATSLHQPPHIPAITSRTINAELLHEIDDYCSRQHITREELLLGCWYLLLGRYSENQQPELGKVENCRSYEAFESICGPIAQVLPLAVSTSNEQQLIDLIRELSGKLSDVRQWQDNFELDNAAALLKGQYTFLKAGFNCIDLTDWIPANQRNKYKIDSLYSYADRFLLCLLTEIHPDSLALKCYYEPANVPNETTTALLAALEELLVQVTGNNLLQVGDIQYTLPGEYQTVMQEYSNVDNQPVIYTLLQAFSNQVQQVPANIAVADTHIALSYGELNTRANQLAHYLLATMHVQPGDRIVAQMPRTTDMMVVLIAILKTGASYIPVDTSIPQERLTYILEDSAAKILITAAIKADQQQITTCPIIAYDELQHLLTDLPGTDPKVAVTKESTCYNIYTSGTTGKPKGVEITHAGLANYLQWFVNSFDINSKDSTLIFSSIAFDLTYTTWWSAIYAGATLHLLPDNEQWSLETLTTALVDKQITYIKLTPSHLGLIVHNPDFEQMVKACALRLIVCGGEMINTADVTKYLAAAPQCRLVNHYGPTETTIGTVFKEIGKDTISHFRDFPVIGKPITNNSAYILDEEGKPVPAGVVGELCIAGAGLAKGYIGLPALTAEKFANHPLLPGTVIYRTGDQARWTHDGNIVFIGRKDFQLKIRGYRIEPGEIEQEMKRIPGIDNVLVIAFDQADSKQLAAYYTGTALSSTVIRQQLTTSLPEYMIPAVLIHLEELPLTPNGKIDRNRLPHPDTRPADGAAAFIEPATPAEHAFAEIWKEVLRYEPVSLGDNFLRKGGDSIKAIQLVSRLLKKGYAIKVFDIFRYPVLNNLIAHAQQANPDRHLAYEQLETAALTPIQTRYLTAGLTNVHHYNQSILLKGRFDSNAVREILDTITTHHEVFRLTFREEENTWTQLATTAHPAFILEEIDLSTNAYPSAELRKHANTLQAGFNITTGPLLRSAIYHLPDADRLLITVHHLITDGVSWRILMEDMAVLLSQYQKKEKLTLTPPSNSWLQWADALHKHAATNDWASELTYWQQQDEAAREAMIPFRDNNGEEDRDSISITMDKENIDILRTGLYDRWNASLNDALVAAVSRGMGLVFGLNKVALALEGHGREDIIPGIDTSRIVGWFTTVFPVVIDVEKGKDPSSLVQLTKNTLDNIPANGIGYGILKYSCHKPLNTPLQVCFNYLGQFETDNTATAFTFAEEERGTEYDPANKHFFALNITAALSGQQLLVEFDYNTAQLKRKQVQQVAEEFKSALLDIANSCNTTDQVSATETARYTVTTLDAATIQVLEQQFDIEDVCPLSPLQQGLFFHSKQTAKDNDPYFRQQSYRFKGQLDPTIVKQAFDLLITRHEVLRAAFEDQSAGQPLMLIFKERTIDFTFIDLSADTATEKAAADFRAADRKKGFDLQHDRLMRVAVLKLAEEQFVINWSYHHIIIDGWSSAILINEFLEVYQALLTQEEKPYTNTSYRKYIHWIMERDTTAADNYWKEYLSGYEALAELPGKKLNREKAYRKTQHTLTIPENQTVALATLAANEQLTLNTVIQVAWAVLLGRYAMQDDLIFGAVVSGRPPEIENIEKIVGLFINVIPVRVQVKGNRSLMELCRQVQYEQARSQMYQYAQLADIQATAGAGKVLFDHFIGFENFPFEETTADTTAASDGLNVEFSANEEQTTFDLYITVVPGRQLTIHFSYNEAVYETPMMQDLAARFAFILEQMIADHTISAAQVELTNDRETAGLLEKENNTAQPAFTDLVACFEQQVQEHPDNIALAIDQQTLTYQACNEWANRLAHHLLNNGIQPGDRIAIWTERSEWTVIAIMGILKAGAAFLPVEPAYPDSRIRYMLQEASVAMLLTDTVEMFRATTVYEGPMLALDVQLQGLETPATNPEKNVAPEDLAYIIFTSGSTGNPKGVTIARSNINYYLGWANQYYFDNNKGYHFPCFTSVGFDLTLTSIFSPLMRGDTLYIHRGNETGEILKAIFQPQSEIRAVKLTPSHISLLPHLDISSTAVSHVIVGGEELTLEQVRILRSLNPQIRIFNEYGPTETTVGCTIAEIEQSPAAIHIGKPIAGAQTFILDQYGKLQPNGIPGEICIGGPGVGSGYLNKPAIDGEKFALNCYTGEKMYRTGDKGRWLPDGNIAYMGRVDDQVKIRGHRIEPGEIQQLINAHDDVQISAVVVTGNTTAEKRLVAYVEWKGHVSNEEGVKQQLLAQVPDYMIPASFITVSQMPLTINGKVDKHALPAPDAAEDETTGYVAPSTEQETKLVQIWEDVLNAKGVGVNDNFFKLGGHSLKVVMVIAKVQKELGVKLDIRTMFDHPTVAKLITVMNREQGKTVKNIPRLPDAPSYQVAHAQQRLWIMDTFEHNSVAYNITAPVYITGNLNVPALEKAFKQIIERQESLRTNFGMENDELRQYIHPSTDSRFTLRQVDLRSAEMPDQEAAKYLQQEMNTPFNLREGSLFRAQLLQVSNDKWLLIMSLHHIISDGWSMEVIINELRSLYNAAVNGVQSGLRPLNIQYRDYAAWQHTELQEKNMEQHREYWLQKIGTDIPQLELPVDFPYPPVQTFAGKTEKFVFDAGDVAILKELADKQQVTLFMTLLAAVKLLLHYYTGQQDMIVGIPVSGRDNPDLESLVGFFVNTLPVRTQIDDNETLASFLEKVKHNVLEAFEHEQYPFDRLVEDLALPVNTQHAPVFDVMVSLQHSLFAYKEEHTPQNITIAPFELPSSVSKYHLTFNFAMNGEQLELELQYNTDLFLNSKIRNIITHFSTLLKAFGNNTENTLQQVNYVLPQEQHLLEEALTNTAVPYDRNATILDLFEARVLQHPDAVAVVFNEQETTYRTLHTRATQLAALLVHTYGLKKQDKVILRIEPGDKMLIAILAVIKAGGVYVPIDPSYPEHSVNYIMEDTAAAIQITDQAQTTSSKKDTQVLQIDELLEAAGQQHSIELDTKITADDPVYIIYTSGSTGVPKGVVIPHRGVVRLVTGTSMPPTSQGKHGLLISSFGFDGSVYSIYNTLLHGGALHILTKETILPVPALVNYIRKHTVNEMFITTSLFNLLVETEPAIGQFMEWVVFGGEEASDWHVKTCMKAAAPGFALYNGYGPTENTVFATICRITDATQQVTIGKPISNSTVIILDKYGRQVPVGIDGEICLGGDGLALGYLNRDELNRERFFIRNGQRYYKTGDLGRLNDNGEIIFRGRADRQVKIRGYRIELGEIEYAIRQLPAVQNAVVAVQGKGTEKGLAAWLVLKDNAEIPDLRTLLKERLPAYMIPAFAAIITELPLTVNGKLDYNRLPAPENISVKQYVAPGSPAEKQLATIWEEVFQLSGIGIQDDFFDIGGHSLKATQIITRVAKVMGVNIELRRFFENPTIAQLAGTIEQLKAEQPEITVSKGDQEVEEFFL